MRKHHYRISAVVQDITSTTLDLNENIKLVLQKVQLKRNRKKTFKYEIVRANGECSKDYYSDSCCEKITSGSFNTTATNIKTVLNSIRTIGNSSRFASRNLLDENNSNRIAGSTKILIDKRQRSKSTMQRTQNHLQLPSINSKGSRLKLFAKSQRRSNQAKNFKTAGDYYREEEESRNARSDLKNKMLAIFKRYNFGSREEDLTKTDVLFKRINMFLTPEKLTSVWFLKYWLKNANASFEEKVKKLHSDIEKEAETKQSSPRSRRTSVVAAQIPMPGSKHSPSSKKLLNAVKVSEPPVYQVAVTEPGVDAQAAQKHLLPSSNARGFARNKNKLYVGRTRGAKEAKQRPVCRQVIREDSKEISHSPNISRQASKTVDQVKEMDSEKRAELEKRKAVVKELAKDAVKNMQRELAQDSEEGKEISCSLLCDWVAKSMKEFKALMTTILQVDKGGLMDSIRRIVKKSKEPKRDYKEVQYLKFCSEEQAVPLPIMSNIVNDVLTLENQKISEGVSRALGRFLPVSLLYL